MEAVGYYKEVSAAGKGNLICNWFLITRGGGGIFLTTMSQFCLPSCPSGHPIKLERYRED
jgi:hypothetical protein